MPYAWTMRHIALRLAVPALLASAVVTAACGSVTPVNPDQSSVQYSQVDLVVGTGTQAVSGSTVNVTYTGWLYSETATDHKGNQFGAGSFSFVVGVGQVIPGFDQGVNGMNVGGTRRLTVPPSLAYGSTGSGPIPPNAALVFEVTLNSVQ